jgi:hypothetical protein
VDTKPLTSVNYQSFYFIDNDRGISGGITTYDELVIHRFFFQPHQTQNSQQTDYFYS